MANPDAYARAPAAVAPPPLFILGSPRSFTSLVCAMLGQHPQAYGVPELNLFMADRLEKLWEEMIGIRQIQLHGLLRTVAQVYGGEQSLNALDLARRWVMNHLDCTTAEIYHILVDRIAPLRVVDKSPVYSASPENLARIDAAFPDAMYLHLVRHPRTQGKSIMNIAEGVMALMVDSVDYSTEPPTVDPQVSWFRVQRNIIDFLDGIPAPRQMRLLGENVVNNRTESLKVFCRWLGMSDDAKAIDAMEHPEDSPFACLGPIGAHLGNDINFLNSPALRDGRISPSTLDGPLPWRDDGVVFRDDVVALARELGYT